MDSSTVEKVIREIEQHSPRHEAIHVGRGSAVGDGVVAIDGLDKALMSEVIEFEGTDGNGLADSMADQGSLYGLVLNLEEDGVRAARSEERRVGKECRSRWSPYH